MLKDDYALQGGKSGIEENLKGRTGRVMLRTFGCIGFSSRANKTI